MQTEKEANFLDRYLLCNYSFSDKTMERVKADVKDFMAARSKDDNYFKFIKWRRTENELAVLTMYAYNDILLPKKYDTVFQIDKPSNFVNVDFTITQAVLDGWAPVNELTKGHKHICVIRFDQEVHNIFRLLALFDPSTTGQDKIQLGFCNLSDFEEIKINLRYV